jgi:NADH pyrophosphatase NudC (nudix superfamily)
VSEPRHCPLCCAPLGRREIGGRPRAVCESNQCGFVFWDNPVPVVAALVEREGMIVLARNHAWPEKTFGLVTGFLERDESPEQAVAREVKEELDLDVLRAELIGNYPFPRRNEVILAYHVVARGEIRLNEELAEFRLVPPEKLRAWDFGTGLAVADWLRRRSASG